MRPSSQLLKRAAPFLIPTIPVLVWAGWFAVFYWFFGRNHFHDDAPAALLGVLATYFMVKVLSRWFNRMRALWRAALLSVLAVLGSWLSISANYWRTAGSAHYPSLSVPLAPLDHATGQPRLGLALSGGGYRAALFHAGVLATLDALNVRASHFSTVSGGSIIGAYYVHGGSPREFLTLVQQDHLNLQRSIGMFPTTLRLMCPKSIPFTQVQVDYCDYTRLDAQADLLDRVLFDNLSFPESAKRARARLVINTTDVRNGIAVALSPEFLFLRGRDRPYVYRLGDVARDVDDSLARISDVVAVSGAFPGAFPTRRVEFELRVPVGAITPFVAQRSNLNQSTVGIHRVEFLLSDGGIIDNTGLRTLFDLDFLAPGEGKKQCMPYPLDSMSQPPLGPPPFLLEESDRGGPITTGMMSARAARETTLGLRPRTEWNLNVVLASDGGAPVKAAEPVGILQEFGRALSLASSFSRYSDPRAICEPNSVIVNPDAWALPELFADVWGLPADPRMFLRIESSRDLRANLPYLGDNALGPRLNLLVATLPNQNKAQSLFSRLREAPMLYKTQHPDQPNLPVRYEIPSWARSYEALQEWIEKGNCDSSRFFELFPSRLAGNCEEIALAVELEMDLINSLRIFRRTSTLQSQIEPQDAAAIFRLGQQLALRSWYAVLLAKDRPRSTIPTGNVFPMPKQ